MRHLSFLAQGLDAGNICPACPKGNGKVVYALDALFGLPRKRAAGVSHRPALHGNLFFCNQDSVDEFVAETDDLKQSFQDCSNFLAGNMLRSSTRYKALEETAVFGSACRREFPALFLNLKHGERLAYSVWIIDQLIDRHSPECNKSLEVYVMYDIACTLKKYLEVRILSMYVYSSIATYYITFVYRVMEDLIFWRKFTFPCLLFMHMGTKHHARLNVQLEELERKYLISHRWASNDSDYVQMLGIFSTEKQTYVAEALWATSARRQFLVKLKVKYAEGHKIAKKTQFKLQKRHKSSMHCFRNTTLAMLLLLVTAVLSHLLMP
jgi:hypothetical protein